ncbi:MAG TPA: amino acid permease [Spirochaetaceae bacterium]|nr:amino acid permease [Spirochaetaceae bacterium]
MGKSKISLYSCIGIIVSGCIGSAIFSLSGLTMYYAGASCIISWIIAAVIQGVYGAEVSELSLHYGKSAGVYAFPAMSLGRIYGFMASWGYVVANIIAISFSAIYVGTYLSVSFVSFSGFQIPIAICSIALCALLNLRNIRDMGRSNIAMLIFLVVLMIAYSAIAFTHGDFSFDRFVPFFKGSKGNFGFIAAVPNALVAYGGVVSVAFIVENVDKPKRNIPLSLMAGLAVVVVLYLMMLVSTLGHIDYAYLENNPGMRFIPMFAASFSSMGDIGFLPKIISLGAVLALLTTMLILGYLTATAMRGMALDGTLPAVFAKCNGNEAPAVSILTYALISCALSLKPSFAEMLVNLGSLVSVIIMVIVIASFVKMKSSGKKFALSALVGCLTIAAMLACYAPGILSGGWQVWAFTVAVYAVGAAVYLMIGSKARTNLTDSFDY